MEARVIGRGALAGLLAGILSFVFTKIFVEPLIDKSIDYESGRGAILNALRNAAGLPTEAEGPEIFSRTFQSTIGVATGLVAISVAFGALIAVAFILLDGRFSVRPRVLAWSVAVFGFLGFFLLPFVKYPANPPAVGHDFTIVPRTQLYLTMVVASLVLLAGATYLARRLSRRWGLGRASLAAGLAFFVIFGLLLGWLPPLGELSSNVVSQHDLGFAAASTETPQPIVNTLGHTLTVKGTAYAPGQLVYPGFDADLLWRFRWYSLLNQVIIWATAGIVFGALMERLLGRPSAVAGRGEQDDRSGLTRMKQHAAVRPWVDDLAAMGPFFEVATHDPAESPSLPWLSLGILLDDPPRLNARVEAVRAALASGVPGGRVVEPRVAASVVHLGLVARVLAPTLAFRARGALERLDLGGRAFAPRVEDLWWQDVLGGPVPLSVADAGLAKIQAPTAVPPAVVDLTECIARRCRLPLRVAWGNVASAANSAAQLIGRARPDLGGAAADAANAVLADPRVEGGVQRCGATFRRRSCCLIYRVAGDRRAVCGDCILSHVG